MPSKILALFTGRRSFVWVSCLLLVVLGALFASGFLPGRVLFSNDGPLGANNAQYRHLPDAFTGTWADLNTLGARDSASPNITGAIQWLLGPLGYAKYYVPLGLLILGLGAWTFFRCLGLAPLACILGALAAMLNSAFFSAGCWGLAAHPITVGMAFFALAALVDTTSRQRWLKVALAGLAVGMGVAEGADIGALFSIYVAAYVMYQAWVAEGNRAKNVTGGVARVTVVALFAGFIAAQVVSTLLATSIQGVAGAQQDARSKEERWDWATQWSLPKREALGLVVPGLFGYRMDTADGGVYWGAVGRDPNWYRYWEGGSQGQQPAGFMRFTGGGHYAGVLVVLIAGWAAAQALRKKDSVFSLTTRRCLWFWMGAVVVSLLLAFGRFAPFYRLLYALPYFSTIRNPGKFLHLMTWALVILFAYGVHGLWRQYMENAEQGAAGLARGLGDWWRKVRGFDRFWTLGCIAALGVAALGFLIYVSSQDRFIEYLQKVQFDAGMAKAIAGFSYQQCGIFLVLFAAAILLLTLVLSGKFRGPRAGWGALLLGLFVLVDLGRANLPWIISWDYEKKYATNPVIERLRQHSYEQRVAILPDWMNRAVRLPPELSMLDQLYRIEWAQHTFLYYNVQSLDIVQMPRMPEDLMAFEMALQPHTMADMPRLLTRRWQLTNTRYLLGPAGFLDLLNQQIDPEQHRFQIAERFALTAKPGVTQVSKLEDFTAVLATNGPFALFEFTGALPRAKLYNQWQTPTNDTAALQELGDGKFDPAQALLVDSPGISAPAAVTGQTNTAGTVEFASYSPKVIKFRANATGASILLLNDRYDPNWKVTVDGQPAKLLRCNYIMRGVQVPAGTHTVEFRFEPPAQMLYVSLAGIGVGILLCGLLAVKRPSQETDPAVVPGPQDSKVAV